MLADEIIQVLMLNESAIQKATWRWLEQPEETRER